MRISDWSPDVCSSDLAVERLFEADLHIVAQIGAAACLRAAARTGAAHELAENILENVAEGAEIGGTGMAPAAPAIGEGGMTEAVIEIGRPSLRERGVQNV